MGLFGRNPVEPDEQRLINETALIRDLITWAAETIPERYIDSISGDSLAPINQLCKLVMADLSINCYQRTGVVLYASDVLDSKIDPELNYKDLNEILHSDEYLNTYVERMTEAFTSNDSSKEVVETLAARGRILKAYIRMIESGLVLEESGFDISTPPTLQKEETHVGRYI